MLPATEVISLAEHERAVKIWKEAAAAALNGQEEEREKRIAAELMRDIAYQLMDDANAKADAYAARVADAEQAMAVMVADMLKRGQMAERRGAVMRAARDLISLNTDAARRRLEQAIAEYDRAGGGDGRQA